MAFVNSLKYAPTINVYNNLLRKRAEFAISYLYSQYHLLAKPLRAHYSINKNGVLFLKKYNNYSSQFLAIKKMPRTPYKKNRNNYNASQFISERSKNSHKNTFIDDINHNIKLYNEKLREQLLNKILNKNPNFFENLITILLSQMGYKGLHGNAITTQSTRDDGIDNIINQDPLGMNTFMIQDKRYEYGHNVSSKEIRNFSGSLQYQGIQRGVFITTSNFTKSAKHQANELHIVTVNGNTLANLMLTYHVGVQVKKNYQILSIDNNFFLN